ncbi:hypothetical protein CCR91_01075 [Thiorhodovibrio winogradskyi]|nr:hypothetical protein [Thiorhodovibrio winogradskyi]
MLFDQLRLHELLSDMSGGCIGRDVENLLGGGRKGLGLRGGAKAVEQGDLSGDLGDGLSGKDLGCRQWA